MIRKIVGVVACIVVITAVLVPVTQSGSSGEDTLDVVILGGQSNAAYPLNTPRISVEEVRETVPLPSTNCYYFGTLARPVYHSTNISTCSILSMVREGEWQIGSEEAAIAYELSKTNNDILVVNVAVPGQPIANFLPGTQYGDRIAEIVHAAESQIPSKYTVHKLGWVWIQGEADPLTPVDEYIDSFHVVQDGFASMGYNTCYLVETRESGNAHTAHLQLLADDKDVKLGSDAPAGFSVASGTLVEGNEIHYTQKGRTIVGEDVGKAIYNDTPINIRSSSVTNLIAIIPLVVVSGLVLAVVGSFVIKRFDEY